MCGFPKEALDVMGIDTVQSCNEYFLLQDEFSSKDIMPLAEVVISNDVPLGKSLLLEQQRLLVN